MSSHQVRIDVRTTDEIVLKVIREIQATSQRKRIPVKVIATKVKCHRNTVETAIKRLRSAGYLAYVSERGRACSFDILRTE